MKPGDKVAHIDQDIEGIVANINGNDINITTAEGFTYTFSKQKLVKIGQDLAQKLRHQAIPKKDAPPQKPKKQKDKHPVLDLHIERLTPKHQHLSAGQKLDLQLQEATRFLQKHRRSHHREVIIIHGHGKNVLKQALIKLLKEKGHEYFDASYVKFGGGALQIRLKK